MVAITCPHCGKVLNVPADRIGKAGRCPQCRNTFTASAALPSEDKLAPASRAAEATSPPPLPQRPGMQLLRRVLLVVGLGIATFIALMAVIVIGYGALWYAVAFGLAWLVYFDASNHKVAWAGAWAVATAVLWVLAAPVYAIVRPNLLAKAVASPREPSRRRLKLWLLGLITVFSVLSIAAQREKALAMKEFAEANRLWDNGDQSTAVTKYRSFLNTSLSPEARSELFCRLIEFDSEHNNLAEAKSLAEKALTSHIDLSVHSPKAMDVIDGVKAALAKRDAEQKSKVAEQKSKQGSGTLLPGHPAEVSRNGKIVKVEISSAAAETIAVNDFGWDFGGALIFKMTSLPHDGALPEKSPWSFSAWDAEGTKLKSDLIIFPGEVRTRETVKAETFSLPTETARVKIHLTGERP